LIQETIRESIPDSDSISMEVVLSNLLSGVMQCWILCAPNQAHVVRAMAITSLIDDPVSGTRDCLMFAALAFVPVSDAVWMRAHSDIMQFAISNNCDRLTTFTKDKRILDILSTLNYNTEYRFCSLELKGESNEDHNAGGHQDRRLEDS